MSLRLPWVYFATAIPTAWILLAIGLPFLGALIPGALAGIWAQVRWDAEHEDS